VRRADIPADFYLPIRTVASLKLERLTFFDDWNVEYMPVAMTREPGTTLPVSARSAESNI
jgi:hypothetical protein